MFRSFSILLLASLVFVGEVIINCATLSKLFVCPLIDKYGVSVYHARQKFADMERFFPLGKCATVGRLLMRNRDN